MIVAFHELIASGSDNSELAELLGQVRDRVRWMFKVDLHERFQESWADHGRILEAVLEGDAERAAALMDKHVAKDEKLLRDRAGSP